MRRLNTRQHSQKARLERCRRITNTIPEPPGRLSQQSTACQIEQNRLNRSANIFHADAPVRRASRLLTSSACRRDLDLGSAAHTSGPSTGATELSGSRAERMSLKLKKRRLFSSRSNFLLYGPSARKIRYKYERISNHPQLHQNQECEGLHKAMKPFTAIHIRKCRPNRPISSAICL